MGVEKELKRAIASADPNRIREAFKAFYETNVRLVYRVLIDSFGKDDETDDDVQEAFASLLDDPVKILQINKLREYLLATAKYICQKRKEKAAKSEEIPFEETLPSDSLKPNELLEQVERLLNHPDSDIVILHAAYCYSEKEISERLGLKVSVVKYKYAKGIKKLRRYLKDER